MGGYLESCALDSVWRKLWESSPIRTYWVSLNRKMLFGPPKMVPAVKWKMDKKKKPEIVTWENDTGARREDVLI